MKKFKIVPSLILLALCVAVLGIGIYAASPASNSITGTVTVTSANAEVQIDVFKNEAIEANRVATSVTTRTSKNITLNSSLLTFERTTEAKADGKGASIEFAEDEDDVAPLTLIFRVTNLSGKDLGVYFSSQAVSAALTNATKGLITTTTTFADANDAHTDAVNATLTGYTELAGKDGNTYSHVDMEVELTLSQLYETSFDVVLTNHLFLNVEPLNTSLLPVLGYDLTIYLEGNHAYTYMGDDGVYASINSSEDYESFYSETSWEYSWVLHGVSSIRFRAASGSNASNALLSGGYISIGGTRLTFTLDSGYYYSEVFEVTTDVECIMWHKLD